MAVLETVRMYRKEFMRADFREEGAKTAIGDVDMTGARKRQPVDQSRKKGDDD